MISVLLGDKVARVFWVFFTYSPSECQNGQSSENHGHLHRFCFIYMLISNAFRLMNRKTFWLTSFVSLSSANDLPSLMEEARLLELQARVYQKSGNVEETMKTLTRAKEVQTRSG